MTSHWPATAETRALAMPTTPMTPSKSHVRQSCHAFQVYKRLWWLVRNGYTMPDDLSDASHDDSTVSDERNSTYFNDYPTLSRHGEPLICG